MYASARWFVKEIENTPQWCQSWWSWSSLPIGEGCWPVWWRSWGPMHVKFVFRKWMMLRLLKSYSEYTPNAISVLWHEYTDNSPFLRYTDTCTKHPHLFIYYALINPLPSFLRLSATLQCGRQRPPPPPPGLLPQTAHRLAVSAGGLSAAGRRPDLWPPRRSFGAAGDVAVSGRSAPERLQCTPNRWWGHEHAAVLKNAFELTS